jgi:hypothetical protein
MDGTVTVSILGFAHMAYVGMWSLLLCFACITGASGFKGLR